MCAASTLSAFIDDLLGLPLAFHPGERYRYGFSCDVLARLVEILSGKRYGDFLRERIFDPLDMPDTGFHVPKEKHHRVAWMYGSFDLVDPQSRATDWWEGAQGRADNLIAGIEGSLESKPHDAERGGHGLVSTAHDYWRFCSMLLNNGELDGVRILGRKTVEAMTINHLSPGQGPYTTFPEPIYGDGFGLGVSVVTDVGLTRALGSKGRYGWGGAASTRFWVDPAEELIGVQMASFQPAEYFPVGADFQNAVYQALA